LRQPTATGFTAVLGRKGRTKRLLISRGRSNARAGTPAGEIAERVDPDRAIAVFDKRMDNIESDAVQFADRREACAFISCCTAVQRTDPQRPASIKCSALIVLSGNPSAR
jgi:hypothetical protein